MTALTISYADYIPELLDHSGLSVDGVEVGPYFSLPVVRQIAREHPQLKMEFHASALGVVPFTRRPLEEYLQVTRSRWISCHIRLRSHLEIWLAMRYQIYFSLSRPPSAIRIFLKRVHGLQTWSPLPVILENMPGVPSRGAMFESDPRIISEILDQTGCGLLLDLGHVRVAAMHRGLDPRDYLAQLPLQAVRQIHVSGPRLRKGWLYDAHESLTEDDYALLEWTLACTTPEVVTLEYFRRAEVAREQIIRLNSIVQNG